MNRSEFERENIATDALSAASASKPVESLHEDSRREHDGRPPAEGLYDPSLEKDSCGVGFIANIKGKKSHQIVSDAMNILCNLEHRGALASNPGRAGRPQRRTDVACDRRLSGACVVEKNLAWSELGQ